MTPKQKNRAIDAEWIPLPPRKMTREQSKRRKRAIRRDVILIVLALVILPVCASYLVEYLVPTVAL